MVDEKPHRMEIDDVVVTGTGLDGLDAESRARVQGVADDLMAASEEQESSPAVQLATAVLELERMRSEAKATAKTFRDRIDFQSGRVATLAEQVKAGQGGLF